MKARDSVPLREDLGGEYTRFLEAAGRIRVVKPHSVAARAQLYPALGNDAVARQQADLGLELIRIKKVMEGQTGRSRGRSKGLRGARRQLG